MTRRTAAEVAAVRHLRRALAELSSEPTAPRYAADVGRTRARGSPEGAADGRAAARRTRLYATLGKLALVVVCFGGVLVALSSRRAFNADAAVAVIVAGAAVGMAAVLRCWWDVAHLSSSGAPRSARSDAALQRARSRWLRFIKQGELTDVPLTGGSGRDLVRPDDAWWITRNE